MRRALLVSWAGLGGVAHQWEWMWFYFVAHNRLEFLGKIVKRVAPALSTLTGDSGMEGASAPFLAQSGVLGGLSVAVNQDGLMESCMCHHHWHGGPPL